MKVKVGARANPIQKQQGSHAAVVIREVKA
jgi:hypothetical protein